MKSFLYFLLSFSFALTAFSSESTEIICEMKRDGWEMMNFELKFLTSKRALSTFQYKKDESSGYKSFRITTVHQTSEARYVGINFLSEEKLVFILVMPIFDPENTGIPMDIEVVSSIYGPMNLKCRATK